MKNTKWMAILTAMVLTIALTTASIAMAETQPETIEQVAQEIETIEEPAAEITPEIETVEEPAPAPVAEPEAEAPVIEAPEAEELPAEEETEEEVVEEIIVNDEPIPLAGPSTNAAIILHCNRSAAAFGDKVTMTAEIIGFDSVNYSIQWQVCRNGVWKNVSGATDSVYTYTYTEAYEGCSWRVALNVA